jgi:hypothetical protein
VFLFFADFFSFFGFLTALPLPFRPFPFSTTLAALSCALQTDEVKLQIMRLFWKEVVGGQVKMWALNRLWPRC